MNYKKKATPFCVFVKIKVSSASNGEAQDDDYYAYGVKGEVYFFQFGDNIDQMYIDLSNANQSSWYYCERGQNNQVEWIKTVTTYDANVTKESTKASANALAGSIWNWLGYYKMATGEGTKTTENFLGRTCDKYVMTQTTSTFNASASVSYSYWIDQATGACLKFTASSNVSAQNEVSSGMFSMEAMEFVTNWQPSFPQVTKTIIDGIEQGGNNGGIEGGEIIIGGDENPISNTAYVNKELAVYSLSTNASDQMVNTAICSEYQNTMVRVFENGNFEVEIPAIDTIVLGQFSPDSSNDNKVILSARKIFDGEEQVYLYEVQDYQNMQITYNPNDNKYSMDLDALFESETITLHFTFVATQEFPMYANIPFDPNGNNFNPQYQVTGRQWKSIFEDKAHFISGNYTVTYSSSDFYSANGIMKVDGNKISVSNTAGEMFYERIGNSPDELGQYDYNWYYPSGNSWVSTPAAYSHAYFDSKTGTIPAPFLGKANYRSDERCYYISKFKYREIGASNDRTITDFKVWFDNVDIKKIQYVDSGYTYTFVYSAHGTTDVTLPS